jgi:hypothetical protein
MVLVAAFNVLMILLGVAVGGQILPIGFLQGLVNGLHLTMGISTPTPTQARWAIIVWIASILLIVDVLFLLFVYVF